MIQFIQKILACAALVLITFPAFNTGMAFHLGDVCMLLAALLNIREVANIYRFQVYFLLAFPLIIISGMADPDGTFIDTVQLVYIFGFLLPFGWVAFSSLTPLRIAQCLIFAGALNSIVAVAQFAGIVPILETQQLIRFGAGFLRAPGFTNACNTLIMLLTPIFALICLLKSTNMRLMSILILMAGAASTIAKAFIFAIPAIIYVLWKEPQKKRFVLVAIVFMAVGSFLFREVFDPTRIVSEFSAALTHRLDRTDNSLADRTQLIEIALDKTSECYFLGFGKTGTEMTMSEFTGNTIHVYYLGVALIGGVPAAIFLMLGLGSLVRQLWLIDEPVYAWFVVFHLCGILVTTVLFFSIQAMPFAVAGSVLVHRIKSIEAQRKIDSQRRIDEAAARRKQQREAARASRAAA